MYQRILVAVDGSPTSKRALAEACHLASDQHAQLRIVHVIDDPYSYYAGDGFSPDTIATVENAWRQSGQKILDSAADLARQNGVQPETALLERGDRTSVVIVDDAKQWQADLLVLGTHGRHGLGELLLGSVAEGVVRTSTVPVLLLHGQ